MGRARLKRAARVPLSEPGVVRLDRHGLRLLILGLAVLAIIGLIGSATEETALESILFALALGLLAVLLSIAIGVLMDVVRWMRDVVDLLDEQVVALDELADRRERVDA